MKIATFDIEAYKWTKLKSVGLYDGKDYNFFTDIDDFADFVLRKRYRNYRIFAHFGGGYDFKFLLPALVERKFKIDIFENGSRIMLIKCSDGKNSWHFVDSYFMLPQAQKKLCESFDVPHQKVDIDFDSLKESDFYKPDMLKRLKNDCIGLYEIIKKYQKWGLNRDKLKPTIASQSMYIFRNRYLQERLFKVSEEAEEFIRKSYYGGRTEIFKMYGEDLKYYDANSLYPTVMLEDMPCGRAVWTSTFQPERIGFYDIEVDMPNIEIPFIPYCHNKKLYFPYGKFNTHVTSVEIKTLIREKIKFKIKRGIYFTDKQKLFKDYIKDLYKIKEKADPKSMDYTISKLLMNSLYGKFAQKRNNERIVIPSDPKQIVEENLKPYYEELNLYKKEEKNKSNFILPYISSYITALARGSLYEKMREVGFNNVYYCDTDSIITTKTMKTGGKLGEWKCEHDKIKGGCFLQPKTYSLKLKDGTELKRVKGMPFIKFGYNDFVKALRTNDISKLKTTYYRIAGLKETLVRYKQLTIKRIAVEKQLKSFYSKRVILEDYTTKPLNVKDLTAV